MSVPLIIPQHVKEARLSLLGAGFKCDIDDPAFAALMFVSIAYNRIPQVNKAEMLRQDLAQTQHELENLSYELMEERKKNARLKAELASRPLSKPAKKEVSALMQANHNLRLQLESLLPEGAALDALAPIRGPKMKGLKNEAANLRNMLTQSQNNLTNAKRAAGDAKGLRTHLKRIKKALDNQEWSPAQKLADIDKLTTYGLLIGTEEQAQIDKAREI